MLQPPQENAAGGGRPLLLAETASGHVGVELGGGDRRHHGLTEDTD